MVCARVTLLGCLYELFSFKFAKKEELLAEDGNISKLSSWSLVKIMIHDRSGINKKNENKRKVKVYVVCACVYHLIPKGNISK